jgi:hypothetical protein
MVTSIGTNRWSTSTGTRTTNIISMSTALMTRPANHTRTGTGTRNLSTLTRATRTSITGTGTE